VIRFLFALILLLPGLAEAQQLMVVKVAEGQHVVFEIDASGGYKFLGAYKSVTIIGTPDPTPPPQPNAWAVTGGLHLIVVDNENERGRLPQSQINILTSKPLRDWLDSNTPRGKDGRPAYRFSSNDSLSAGGKGRELELPVYVQGWDLLMKSGVALPAWIIGNGRRTVIEPLPKTVAEAQARLEALR
jgi:hypothetical protein